MSPLSDRQLKDSLTLNFWPQVNEIALAYKDLAEKFEWKRMIILTTGSTGRGGVLCAGLFDQIRNTLTMAPENPMLTRCLY